MTLDHQCEAVDSDSSWEDLESEEELYPTFDPDSKNWAEEFSNSIRRFHGTRSQINPSYLSGKWMKMEVAKWCWKK